MSLLLRLSCKICVFILCSIEVASQYIQMCRTAEIGENCNETNPVDTFGHYESIYANDKIYFQIIPDEVHHFGRYSKNTPYNCHFMEVGDKPTETNRFIGQGCPEKGGVTIYRSTQPIRIEAQLNRLLPYNARLDEKFVIRCFIVQCSTRKGPPRTGHECPDPFHCDQRVAWFPRIEHVSEAETPGQITIRLSPDQQRFVSGNPFFRRNRKNNGGRQGYPLPAQGFVHLTAN